MRKILVPHSGSIDDMATIVSISPLPGCLDFFERGISRGERHDNVTWFGDPCYVFFDLSPFIACDHMIMAMSGSDKETGSGGHIKAAYHLLRSAIHSILPIPTAAKRKCRSRMSQS